MSKEDIAHYHKRITEERDRAAKAKSKDVAQAHLMLVTMYENLVERMERDGAATSGDAVPRPAFDHGIDRPL